MMPTLQAVRPQCEGDNLQRVQGASDCSGRLPQWSTEGQSKKPQQRDDTAEHGVLK